MTIDRENKYVFLIQVQDWNVLKVTYINKILGREEISKFGSGLPDPR